ncbi:type II toxin-antitoxin system HicB family antitoxin [Candidatus Competibacter phosphatis]|mgnify:FL=1|uniref:Type II toxin-antitoxin system HicB family antitoxin n=1 Tax=Candidatus Competibacter phosphatis TaxID=221280 RepID=A0ABX1TP51_9GAMM|nr:type II toxin-antitoxin system HicB family antitoxin [Candidatus Competibacter phosphatis]MCB1795916.1 type II toxin-antitoxin system HicB family antitoxin [Candidatus Competibacteraceae bacterium]NMQ20454.1 type II toxin-antitoxin system HicB family antitoxin [Candidatus Competibacter phosphatis]HRW66676.1 type II toxin-antitoxin system HicB family antitoxin [Candidatus Competibacter sp.]
MINLLDIDGYQAVVSFDPELGLFRGEFVGLSGGADFYADNVADLRKEGATSLKVFLDMCAEDGVEPRKTYSGRFILRLDPELHARAVARAQAEGKSLNEWAKETIKAAVSS